MAEYTIKDVIIDPQDPRLEGAIGKKVYYGITPYSVLSHAKGIDKDIAGTYRGISHTDIVDYFLIEESQTSYDCIILKKEEPKPKYVPFESIEEFLTDYFKSVANSECIQKTISSTGIWLKHNDAFLLVVEIWDRGVVIGDINMQTTEIDEDEYLTVHGVTKWKELLEDYTFLDGSPCGKEAK